VKRMMITQRMSFTAI